ncbi:hypothetical protein M378DRAFT_13355 [Amanita muscaria Koide BX008]|uniref:Uncharacterized protein n=1 Tax=Amanita muscaria (strain Koide BX008) TaxID=946122 RepID=A0A0C2WXU7_AMAMK|nr:hypothetical protein M378DRAFT_13355 [Amanita muscaria Koide BX008]
MIVKTFITSILLATAAFAAPGSLMEERRARRAAAFAARSANRQSQPLLRSTEHPVTDSSDIAQISYSSNWAGASWETYPAGTFKSVTGTFTVPTPTGADGSASAWVGIDGDTCQTAILQTGIDFHITSGVVSYDAWYEWYPAFAFSFSGITISAGDVIKLTVTATTTKSGTAVIENVTTGVTVSKSLKSAHALCEQNAEWIVEDYSQGGGLVPFCNFGSVKFTSSEATTVSGTLVDPNGATVIDIEQNGVVLTNVTEFPGGVTISYV